MSVLKSELKMLVTHEIGVRVEDSLESAKKDLAVFEGRQAAFVDGAKAVEALLGFIDKDVEENKLGEVIAGDVKRYVTRAVHALQNLSQQAANQRIAHTGKVQALEQMVVLIKNMVDAERDKVSNLKASEEAPPSGPRDRPIGAAPALSIKEQRLAEEAAETQSAAPVPEVPPVVEEVVAPVLEAAPAPEEAPQPAPEPEMMPPQAPWNGFKKKQGKTSHGRNAR